MVASVKDWNDLSRYHHRHDSPGAGPSYRELYDMPTERLKDLLDTYPLPDPRLLDALLADGRATVRALAATKKEEMERRLKRLKGKNNLRRNERVFRDGGYQVVAGVDEAGRGALAGPLVAAAVVIEKGTRIPGAKDSKLLTPPARDRIYELVMSKAADVSVACVDHKSIDDLGLQKGNIMALNEAVSGLSMTPDCVICDNYTLDDCEHAVFGLPFADGTFFSVAVASIVAKVERDRIMTYLHERYPAYGFHNNKGYGTPEHIEALRKTGPSPVHRLSFHGVLSPEEEGRLW